MPSFYFSLLGTNKPTKNRQTEIKTEMWLCVRTIVNRFFLQNKLVCLQLLLICLELPLDFWDWYHFKWLWPSFKISWAQESENSRCYRLSKGAMCKKKSCNRTVCLSHLNICSSYSDLYTDVSVQLLVQSFCVTLQPLSPLALIVCHMSKVCYQFCCVFGLKWIPISPLALIVYHMSKVCC